VCVCVCTRICVSPIVARQRLGRNVTAVTNTHATIEELLDASFSMWPLSHQVKQAIRSSHNFLFHICGSELITSGDRMINE
jgi:hypothetical protein